MNNRKAPEQTRGELELERISVAAGLEAVGLLVLVLAVAGAVAGCGSGSRSSSGSGAIVLTAGSTQTTSPAPSQPHPPHRAAPTRRNSGTSSPCPSAQNVLVGVYHPDRLTVLDACQRVTGTVESVRVEPDGDVHYDIAVDRVYSGLLSAGNVSAQHGWLVVELMPRDGGHLPEPALGDRVALVGALVDDSDHSWHEIHPVFSQAIDSGPARASGPQYGGSPPSDRSFDAAAGCRTPRGALCAGYGPPSSASRSPSAPGSGAAPAR